MIEVSRINGKYFVINSELIETIETTPDTIITLTNGKKVIVRESKQEIIEKVISFKKRIYLDK